MSKHTAIKTEFVPAPPNPLTMVTTESTSRKDLEAAVLAERELYDSFDEAKLLNGSYSDEELRNGIVDWIQAGSEV